MRLAHAQYQGGETWVGVSNGGPTAAVGPQVEEANSVWAAAQGSALAASANRAVKPGRGIFAKGHTLVFGLAGHVSLRIVPHNQDWWLQRRPDLFSYYEPIGGSITSNVDGFSNRFFTIGAGPDAPAGTDFQCTSNPKLISAPNRDKDVHQPPERGWLERLRYSPLIEDALVFRLIELDDRYADDLTYECFPDSGTDEFNSNSYAAGLIDTGGLPRPMFPSTTLRRFPGWYKPVPPESFRRIDGVQ
jgi:hypothetical protein